MIPKGWLKRRLEDLSTKPISYGIVQTGDPVENGVKCLRVVDITKQSIDLSELITTTEYISQSYKRTILEENEIVLALRGEIGKSLLVPSELAGCNLTRGLARISPNGKVLPEFLFQLLASPQMRREFELRTNGSALREIPIGELRQVSLLLPPLPEQHKIAAILSTWDRGIELTEKLIAAKQKRKQALIQQLLTGRVRFKEFMKSKNRQRTPIGDMPCDWKIHRLGKIVEKVKRKNPDGVVLVLTASGEHGLVDQREFFNRSVAGADLSGYYLLKRGEFAYNRSAMKGYPFGAIKRLDRYEQGVLSTLYICFQISDDTCDPDYLSQFFEACLLDKQLRGITQVGGRAHGLLNITDGDFYSMTVTLPSVEEQRKISAVLDCQDKEIEGVRQKLALLKQQKMGLMQQLLTGKVRVNVDAKLVNG